MTPDRSDRARLKSKLPPLRLPTTSEERRRFERRLDARLATLARSADCTPEQCIGLALWLRSQGWKGFELVLPDCEENPTGAEFARNLLYEAAQYDTQGRRRNLKGDDLAYAAIALAGKLALPTSKKGGGKGRLLSTWSQYARRKRDPAYQKLLDSVWVETAPKHWPALPPQLQASYDDPSIPVPRDIVRRAALQQLKRELEQSAARLQSS